MHRLSHRTQLVTAKSDASGASPNARGRKDCGGCGSFHRAPLMTILRVVVAWRCQGRHALIKDAACGTWGSS